MPTTKNGNGSPRMLTDLQFELLVENVMSSRSELFKQIFDPRRDINDECGYPRDGETLSAEKYHQLWEREAVAARVVEVLPKESWQVQPLVFETEDAGTITPFEQAWDDLGQGLGGESSWYQDEAGSPVWEYLLRADILSGIGQFGVLLLGLDDGKDLASPAFTPQQQDSFGPDTVIKGADAQYFQETSLVPAPAQPSSSPFGQPVQSRKLLFLRAFPEALCQITQFEADIRNPRFGMPVMYQLTLNDPRMQYGGIGLSTATINVHWSRVIHVADCGHTSPTSEVFAVPRMRPVLNRLLDLRKLYGGSAEMYWRGAFPGYTLETHPQLGGDVEIDKQATRDMMENYMNGLQRYLVLMGMSMKGQAPQVVDPTQQINVQIEAICIKLGIPKRIFMGSERGELASSQDDKAWNDRLRERQHNYITPRIIVPFVDRLIKLGVLPEPEGYSVEWPDLTSQSDQEKATVASSRTAALAQYVGGGVEAVVPPLDYLTRILGMDEDEAGSILEKAAQAAEGQERLTPETPAAQPAKGSSPPSEEPTASVKAKPMGNASFFESCPRDERGRCTSGEGGGAAPTGVKPTPSDRPSSKVVPKAHVSTDSMKSAIKELRADRPVGDIPLDMLHAKLSESNPGLTLTQTMESAAAAHKEGSLRLGGLSSARDAKDPAAVLEREGGQWRSAPIKGGLPVRSNTDSTLYYYIREG